MQQQFLHRNRVADIDTNLFITDAGSTTLTPVQTFVKVNLSGSDTHTITLPPVGLSKGVTISIVADADGGGVTIQDQNDSHGWSDQTTDADDEYLIVQCDGLRWNILATNIS